MPEREKRASASGGARKRVPPSPLQADALERLEQQVLPSLRERLRFAKAAEVAQLICIQSSHAELSEETLAALAAGFPKDSSAALRRLFEAVDRVALESVREPYVEDCDRVAEYLRPGTTDGRRAEIRDQYWLDFAGPPAGPPSTRPDSGGEPTSLPEGESALGDEDQDSETDPDRQRELATVPPSIIERRLMAMRRRYRADASDADLPIWQSRVEQAVFSAEAFGRVASKYQPALGKTFSSFLGFQVDRRCLDAVQGTDSGDAMSLDQVLEQLVAKAAKAGQGGGVLGSEAAEAAMIVLLLRLEQVTSPRNPRLGIEIRAVWELHRRAYWNPDRYGAGTTDILRARGTWDLEGFRQEYADDQVELDQLANQARPELTWQLQSECARATAVRRDLEALGCGHSRLAWLAANGRASYVGDGEKRLRAARVEGKSQRECLELAFVLEHAKAELTRRRLEKVEDSLARYRRQEYPWVRQQGEIERLTGLDQVTVSRRLAAAEVELAKEREAR
ncbi:MAG: hypothetical protein FJ387_15570 [Verrucomicrobia bacterium]|nr:hypothetical protein [Verrucomicrobiota bacterium]